MEKKLYSVTDMKNDLKKIINQIKISKLDPELIISINRGGCIPGIYLSHYLKKTHRVIDIQLRDSDSKPNFDVMKDSLNNFNKILIIDDIIDSGLTFGLVKKIGISIYDPSECEKIFNLTSTFKSHSEEDGSVRIRGMASTADFDRAGDSIISDAWTKGGLGNFEKNNAHKLNY